MQQRDAGRDAADQQGLRASSGLRRVGVEHGRQWPGPAPIATTAMNRRKHATSSDAVALVGGDQVAEGQGGRHGRSLSILSLLGDRSELDLRSFAHGCLFGCGRAAKNSAGWKPNMPATMFVGNALTRRVVLRRPRRCSAGGRSRCGSPWRSAPPAGRGSSGWPSDRDRPRRRRTASCSAPVSTFSACRLLGHTLRALIACVARLDHALQRLLLVRRRSP